MARQPALAFDAVRVEGGLISADFLARVAALDAGHQAASDYGVPRGLSVRDEIGRAWRIAEAHWREVLGDAKGGSAARERAVLALLRDALGWQSIQPVASAPFIGDRAYPISASALAGSVPIVVAAANDDLDAANVRFGDGARRRSPFGLVQEFLNASEGALWGLVTNGRILRVVRDNASLTRPAWIEVDLARIFAEQRYADFSLCWLLLHESRFGRAGAQAHEAILEQWRAAGLEAGTVARDRLREGVEAALRALGTGFLAHPSNSALRERLTSGALDAAAYQQQLLRVVYRMIFLLVAEERELLHAADDDLGAITMYRAGYGLQRLRERSARRRAYDRHDDAWDSLVVAFRGCSMGEPRLGLPGLGGLFAVTQCADLDMARLANRALLDAVFRLTWLPHDHAVVRVNWRDMGTEELGSVYESLLELVPEVAEGAWKFGFVGDVAPGRDGGSAAAMSGNARKLSGSYYTPDSLVQALLDSALEPVIARALDNEEPEQALLRLAVLDPAMGSGHFLLGAARRLAAHLARLRVDGTPGPDAFRHALRDVVAHCVYGVDKNAMAVELARIALWLEAMEPGKPLAFLDHHLAHGDAILGVLDPAVLEDGIPAAAFTALTGDDADVLKALKKANAEDLKALEQERLGQLTVRFDASSLARELAAVDALPDDTLAEIEAKREALEGARSREDARFRFACDAYVAAFLLRKDKDGRALVPTTGTLRNLALGMEPPRSMRQAVAALSHEVPFLHWPITFAQIMARGGFDCVLGNPPWEKVKLSEKEFFATRDPRIAQAANAAARTRAIRTLADALSGSASRRLFDAFERAKQEAEGTSQYARNGGRFPLTGSGDVNLYALFAEAGLRLVHPEGRAGLVLPSGIASDAGTAPYFRHVTDGRLASLIDFENRDALFAGVHRSYKFCLLTIGKSTEPLFAFFLTQPEQRFDERRRFTLAAADFQLINPNTGTCPVFRSASDADLVKKLYRQNRVLRSDDPQRDSGFHVRLRRMFDKSTDSHLLLPRRTSTQRTIPVMEGDYGHQFNHRFATYRQERQYETAEEWLAEPLNTVDTEFGVEAETFDNKIRSMSAEDNPCRTAFLGFRRVARSTDERTVVACVFPWMPSTYGWILTLGTPASGIAVLCALYNSLTFDWLVRCALSQPSIPQIVFEQTAVPASSSISDADRDFLVSRVLELSYTSYDLAPWAGELGHHGPPFRWDSARRALVRSEIDAWVARKYGLSRNDLRYLLDPRTTHGHDFPSETFRVLRQREERELGEYRTSRLVLEAWDRLYGSE